MNKWHYTLQLGEGQPRSYPKGHMVMEFLEYLDKVDATSVTLCSGPARENPAVDPALIAQCIKKAIKDGVSSVTTELSAPIRSSMESSGNRSRTRSGTAGNSTKHATRWTYYALAIAVALVVIATLFGVYYLITHHSETSASSRATRQRKAVGARGRKKTKKGWLRV